MISRWNFCERAVNGLNLIPCVAFAMLLGSWWIILCTDLDSPISLVGCMCFLFTWDYHCVRFALRAVGIVVDKDTDTGYTDQR